MISVNVYIYKTVNIITDRVLYTIIMIAFKCDVKGKQYFADMYPSDLEKWYKSSDPLASVFLYDLDKYPSEANNLASRYPNLVKELLIEAEKAIENAPKQTFTIVRQLSLKIVFIWSNYIFDNFINFFITFS